MLRYNNLDNYYSTNFSLMQHHKYTLSDINHMIPFERDLYVQMIINYLKEVEEKQKQHG